MQVIDSRHATVSVSAYSHLQRHLSVARCRGEGLPMAVAIGVAEAVVMAGAAALPYGVNELAFAGALQGRPLLLAPCETIPCLVPVDSQYIIEGHIHPRERVCDGPFFDYTGRPSVNPSAYLFEVSAIRHRPNPVFRGAAIGLPGAEDHELYSYLAGCNLVDFHGNRLRNRLQRHLFAARSFRLLQLSGRLSSRLGAKAEG
jgi:4-hydroxy-3-polyprenylbenzoate decarboxylase